MSPSGGIRESRVPPMAMSSPSSSLKTTLSAGDHVRHAKFGVGIVVNCLSAGDDQEVTVAFKGEAGLKRLLLSLAPLEKV